MHHFCAAKGNPYKRKMCVQNALFVQFEHQFGNSFLPKIPKGFLAEGQYFIHPLMKKSFLVFIFSKNHIIWQLQLND